MKTPITVFFTLIILLVLVVSALASDCTTTTVITGSASQCEGQKSLQPNVSSSATKKVESRIFFVGTPLLIPNWELVSLKNNKTWYSLLDNDGIYLIGPDIIKPVKKVIVITEDGKRYQMKIQRKIDLPVTQTNEPIPLTKKEMEETHAP